MKRLEGKSILVAGAGGIGNDLARRYCEEGARVVLADINLSAAEAAAAEIKENGGQVIGAYLDGKDAESIEAAVRLTCESFGGLDGLHANFAAMSDGLLDVAVLDLPLETFDEVMQVNARGFFLCTRAALPHLIERGGGSILYTSSGAAHSPERVRVPYSMSKAAIHALARIVATRHGPDNIRANVIAPGVIIHKQNEEIAPEWFIKWAYDRIPLKARLGRAEDISAMAALLMSDEGAFVTGQVISVDGGATMRL